jgi:hypothetical protein
MDDKAAFLRVKAKIEALKAAREALLQHITDVGTRRVVVDVLQSLEQNEEVMLRHYALEIANAATGG